MKELRAFLRLGACTVLPLILFALLLARLRAAPLPAAQDIPSPSAAGETEAPAETEAPKAAEPLFPRLDRERQVKLITPEGTLDTTLVQSRVPLGSCRCEFLGLSVLLVT